MFIESKTMPKHTDILEYKVEMLEKRLDMLEQLIYTNKASGSASGANADVIALLMNIIRDQMATKPNNTNSNEVDVKTSDSANGTGTASGSGAAELKDLSFARRRSII